MNYYNFRIDRRHMGELIKRLREESKISMGWGGNKVNIDLTNSENIKERFRKAYPNIKSRKINNIRRIEYLKDDDVLVVPHLPENGRFIVGVVDGDFPACYSYIENDNTHLNHTIKLKEIYGLDGNLDIHNIEVHEWYAKLKNMQLPIYPLFRYEKVFAKLLLKLRGTPNLFLPISDLDKYNEELKLSIIQVLCKKLNNISPSSSNINFENICKYVIESYGYKYLRNHHYANGGDADLIFESSSKTSSPFESGISKLYVQVKKQTGDSNTRAVEQLVSIMKEDDCSDDVQGCAITLGSFNEDAKKLAQLEDIVLIEGEELAELFLGSLFANTEI